MASDCNIEVRDLRSDLDELEARLNRILKICFYPAYAMWFAAVIAVAVLVATRI